MTTPTSTNDELSTTSQERAPLPAPSEQALPVLTVVAHPDERLVGCHDVVSAGAELVLGRESTRFMPGLFDFKKISRRHARLVLRDPSSVEVTDLDSRNGVYVNERRVTSAALAPGDVLRIGDVALLFHRLPGAGPALDHPRFIGISTAMGHVVRAIEQVARRPTSVVIIGETGSGKDLVAQEIHRLSGRSGELVVVNAGGISETLIASELFGHVKGAFTGADRRRAGLIETASGGSLFLDEIIDAPPSLQASLLRVFETNTYRPVGSDRAFPADVRFIVAAQPVIEARLEEGRFRLDLWTRMARWVIRVPSLRERPEDIPILVRHFTRQFARRDLRVSHELLLALLRYDWPGNVRELMGVVERLVIAHEGSEVLTLDQSLVEQLSAVHGPPSQTGPMASPIVGQAQKAARERPSAERLVAALREHGGNVRATAKVFGVTRKTVYAWIAELGVDLEQTRARS